MNQTRGALVVPILIITVGIGWLLTTQNIVPGIDWVWSLGLAVAGLLTLLAGGLDKVSVVVGPFFLVASVLSVLRQTGRLSLDTEVPILVILVGVLLLVARMPTIPAPSWVIDTTKPSAKK